MLKVTFRNTYTGAEDLYINTALSFYISDDKETLKGIDLTENYRDGSIKETKLTAGFRYPIEYKIVTVKQKYLVGLRGEKDNVDPLDYLCPMQKVLDDANKNSYMVFKKPFSFASESDTHHFMNPGHLKKEGMCVMFENTDHESWNFDVNSKMTQDHDYCKTTFEIEHLGESHDA